MHLVAKCNAIVANNHENITYFLVIYNYMNMNLFQYI